MADWHNRPVEGDRAGAGVGAAGPARAGRRRWSGARARRTCA
ncbi:hypothetical protein [Alicyclobacillus macrosporangiidus]|nr:hypothetical protein [Alicyclobacillus macrosporangiidus]